VRPYQVVRTRRRLKRAPAAAATTSRAPEAPALPELALEPGKTA